MQSGSVRELLWRLPATAVVSVVWSWGAEASFCSVLTVASAVQALTAVTATVSPERSSACVSTGATYPKLPLLLKILIFLLLWWPKRTFS